MVLIGGVKWEGVRNRVEGSFVLITLIPSRRDVHEHLQGQSQKRLQDQFLRPYKSLEFGVSLGMCKRSRVCYIPIAYCFAGGMARPPLL